ncbi:MAG: ABC transporter ATP-binding protein [Fibrobacterota bacterium]
MSEVIIRKIRKLYGSKVVIPDLSLTIHDGEFLTLLGPSGCGKTTTLNMVAGLESISGGDILVGGRCYNELPARKRNIGMVFQSYALFPHMTVDQNIAFGLKIKKKERLEIFDKLEWVKNLLHLSDKGRSYPRELSGGERQRVALGRALVLEPDVLLLDEPLSNLDQELRESMTTELKKIHQDVGCTMIYVTHNQMEAMRMSDRIAIMRDGRLMQCDAPMTIFNFPQSRFVATFIGAPAMNMYPAHLIADGDDTFAEIGDVRLRLERERGKALRALSGRDVVAGIRPQQIYCFKDKPGKRHSDTEIEVETGIVEPLGERFMIDAKFGGQTMVFFMVSDRMPVRGEKIRTIIDGRHIHLFDRDNGERIGLGESSPSHDCGTAD